MEPVSVTAQWTAATRARESDSADPLFDDPLAGVLAGPEGFALLNTARNQVSAPAQTPAQTSVNAPADTATQPDTAEGATADSATKGGGEHAAAPASADEAGAGSSPTDTSIVIRTRFVDDQLLRIVDEEALTQVVVVAAGMDTRAFRLDWPAGVTLYEVDRPELLEIKEQRLSGVGAEPRCGRVTVGVDLVSSWIEQLSKVGFRADRPTVWLVEGLLVYLEEEAVHGLLERISHVSAPGSWLLTDLLGSSFLNHPRMREWLRELAENGTPWLFGTDDPERLLARHGWRASVWQYGEEGASFGRWPYPVAPRNVDVPHSYLVAARHPAGG